jgi:hypothetical protein
MNERSPTLGIVGRATIMVLLSALSRSGLNAQTTDLSVEVGGSSVSPPVGVEGEDARFFVAGLRGLRFNALGSGVMGSFLVGRSLQEGTGGDFLSGTVEGRLLKRLGPGWAAGVEVEGFGFRVAEPFPYRFVGLEGGPVLQFSNRNLSASLKGVAGGGWSETELQRTGREPAEIAKDELWRYGGTGEVLAGGKGVLAGVAVGLHESSGGTYRSGGLRLLAEHEGAAIELRVDIWDSPSGHETTGGLAFVLPLGGWDLRGFLGRTEPDPLTLTEPGGGSGGILIGRRLVRRDPLPPPKPPLHRVVEKSARGAVVEIHAEAPEGTGQMAVMGDFTFWEPVAMTREGTRWSAQLEIPTGTHHFGFLADGVWYLPEDAPDAVPDDWGRKNATIVIEEGQDPAPPAEGPRGGEGAAGR